MGGSGHGVHGGWGGVSCDRVEEHMMIGAAEIVDGNWGIRTHVWGV